MSATTPPTRSSEGSRAIPLLFTLAFWALVPPSVSAQDTERESESAPPPPDALDTRPDSGTTDGASSDEAAGGPPGPAFAVELAGGVQALGFAPLPPNPTVTVGAELGLFRDGVYQLRLGLALGYFHQPQLIDAFTVDIPVVQRFTADFGLYGDLEVVLGAEIAGINTPTYQRADDGRLAAGTAPIDVHARLGLGVAVGFDFGRLTNVPIRAFVRYRQLVLAPFMQGNEVPVMGLAALTGGIAVELDSWIH